MPDLRVSATCVRVPVLRAHSAAVTIECGRPIVPDEVRAIMAAQASRERRLQAADDIIDNSGDLAMLRQQVDALHRHYLTLAQPTT